VVHYDLLNEEGKQRHQDLMHDADHWRLQQRVRRAHPLLPDRLRLHLGERLITWGMQLKARTQPAPQPD
jgi:hypothetical protein